MLTIADIERHIEGEFGSRLEPLGFQRLSGRKWVRSTKRPIRELFAIIALDTLFVARAPTKTPSWIWS